MKTILMLTIFTVFSANIFSQDTLLRIEKLGFLPSGISRGDGEITIHQDIKLLAIVDKHIRVNDNKFPGWRVQIYFGSGNQAVAIANNIKTAFLKKHDDCGAYIIYDQPYFKLRVGDFRTKAEAMRFKQKMSRQFPNTWIIPDEVNYPEDVK